MNIADKNLYYIGGVVRDELLGYESIDIDLTYNGNAIEYAKTIAGAEIIRINEPFGTIKIKLGDEEIDIASTRSERYDRKGHLPIVDKIGCSLKEDVLRRDFTINALAKSTLSGEIIDYVGGIQDLKDKKLRVLHDESFIDDPTRILRGLKFSVRFGFELDSHTKKLQKEYLENINYDMSYKRLKKELMETFNLNNRPAFEVFVKNGIYKLISPVEFNLPEYDFAHLITRYNPENVWIIYVGLLPDVSALPLTKIDKKIIDEYKRLLNSEFNPDQSSDFEIYKIFKNIPLETVIMYSVVNNKVVERYLTKLQYIKPTITGEDIQKLGVSPSSQYQECFDYIVKRKIETPELTKQEEILLVKKFFNLQ